MDVESHRRAQEIFDTVVDLPLDQRRAAVRLACAGDVALLAMVEELLSLDDEGDSAVMGLVDQAAVEAALGPVPLEPGHRVDRYKVLRLLGVGGTARVWEVQHRTLGTRHALKVLTWAEPRMQRRLLREARTQARLVHPNVVPVSDVIEVNGAPGLLMPLIDGPPLDELLADHRPTVGEAVGLLRGIAAGIAYAHAEGFAHRDLKPANVLVDIQGDRFVPRVADFGLVKGAGQKTMTRPGMVLGTLSYAAPEQLFDTSTAAEPADVWALGVLAYELLAGERPFRGSQLQDILDSHQRGPDLDALPAVLPDDVRELLGRMLRVDPAERPQHMGEVLRALPEGDPLRLDTELGRVVDALRLEDITGTHRLRSLDPPEEDSAALVPPAREAAAPREPSAPSDGALDTLFEGESQPVPPVPPVALSEAARSTLHDEDEVVGVGEAGVDQGGIPAPAPPSEARGSRSAAARRSTLALAVAVPVALVLALVGVSPLADRGDAAAPSDPVPVDTEPDEQGVSGEEEVADEGSGGGPAPVPVEPTLSEGGAGVGGSTGTDLGAEAEVEAETRELPAEPASRGTRSAGRTEDRGTSAPVGSPATEAEASRGAATEPEAERSRGEADATDEAPPSSAPTSATATVEVQGGPSVQRLVSRDGRILSPGEVPVGRYRFEAQMEKRGNWVSLELPALQPGDHVVIACMHEFGYCKIEGQ